MSELERVRIIDSEYQFDKLAEGLPEEFLDAGVDQVIIDLINTQADYEIPLNALGTKLLSFYHPRANAFRGANIAIINLDTPDNVEHLIVMDEHGYEIISAAPKKNN